MILPIIVALLGFAAPAAASAAPQIVAASGRWAALRGDRSCEAATLGLLPATRTRGAARASLAFEPGRRRGEFAALLSRKARDDAVMLTIGETPFLLVARGNHAWSRGPVQEAAIIAAIRASGGMRLEARSVRGTRFVDRFDLAGAPTAIDAAAACAAALVKR